jgi:hypothetical protein
VRFWRFALHRSSNTWPLDTLAPSSLTAPCRWTPRLPPVDCHVARLASVGHAATVATSRGGRAGLLRRSVDNDNAAMDAGRIYNVKGWQISVVTGLNAHFNQPDGSSKPGTDWAVSIRTGETEERVLVRTYSADHPGLTPEALRIKVGLFISDLLIGGWKPSDYRHTPGELVLPPSATES